MRCKGRRKARQMKKRWRDFFLQIQSERCPVASCRDARKGRMQAEHWVKGGEKQFSNCKWFSDCKEIDFLDKQNNSSKLFLKASQWPDLHYSHITYYDLHFAKRNTKGRTGPNQSLIKSVNSKNKKFHLN